MQRTSELPAAAREAAERAWLAVLAERYPGVRWILVERSKR